MYFFAHRQSTICWAHVHRTVQPIQLKSAPKIYLPKWTKTTTANWHKTNSWKDVYKTKNCQKCLHLKQYAIHTYRALDQIQPHQPNTTNTITSFHFIAFNITIYFKNRQRESGICDLILAHTACGHKHKMKRPFYKWILFEPNSQNTHTHYTPVQQSNILINLITRIYKKTRKSQIIFLAGIFFVFVTTIKEMNFLLHRY